MLLSTCQTANVIFLSLGLVSIFTFNVSLWLRLRLGLLLFEDYYYLLRN